MLSTAAYGPRRRPYGGVGQEMLLLLVWRGGKDTGRAGRKRGGCDALADSSLSAADDLANSSASGGEESEFHSLRRPVGYGMAQLL